MYNWSIIIHMQTSKIQIPVNKDTLEKSKKRATALGFNSVNEVIRIFLAKFGDETINIALVDSEYEKKITEYSKKLDKDFDETLEKIKSGKAKSYSTAQQVVNAMDEAA
jgi:predicted AlkP superfamily phosphohydrolase/phosphomutase